MKLYELTFLISPDLSETELKSFQEKIRSLIENKGGVLVNVDEPIKKKLAYPIKNHAVHTQQNEAYLTSFNFQLNQDKLGAFGQELRAEGNILRFLIITKKLAKKVPEVLIKKPPKVTKIKKVELKEIEKKLEEILGE